MFFIVDECLPTSQKLTTVGLGALLAGSLMLQR